MNVHFKNIIDSIESFCNNHLQVNEFGFGVIADIGTTEHKYPLVFIQPMQNTIAGRRADIKLEMFVIDLLKTDGSNQVEVLSDTFLIANDIVAEFFDNETKYGFTINETNIPCDPMMYKFDSLTAGYVLQLTCEVENGLSNCAIPTRS